MKRSVLLILLAFGLVVMAFAHGPKRTERPAPGAPHRSAQPARTVTVSGDIIIVRGSPAVKSGNVIYILNRNFSLFGLVDGLKEGAKVTIEGRAMGTPRDENVMFLVPSKLTFNGKTYENLESSAFDMGPGRNFQGRGGSRQPENFQGRGGSRQPGNFRHPKSFRSHCH